VGPGGVLLVGADEAQVGAERGDSQAGLLGAGAGILGQVRDAGGHMHVTSPLDALQPGLGGEGYDLLRGQVAVGHGADSGPQDGASWMSSSVLRGGRTSRLRSGGGRDTSSLSQLLGPRATGDHRMGSVYHRIGWDPSAAQETAPDGAAGRDRR